jgi:hypothetical protein
MRGKPRTKTAACVPHEFPPAASLSVSGATCRAGSPARSFILASRGGDASAPAGSMVRPARQATTERECSMKLLSEFIGALIVVFWPFPVLWIASAMGWL